jgi:hypothetical protein
VVWLISHNKREEPLWSVGIDPPTIQEASMARDPRSDAEKARADLARNSEMGMAVPESPLEQEPSVTPRTFGDTTENARVRSNMDQTVEEIEASRDIGDSTGTDATSRDIPVTRGLEETPPTHRGEDDDDDALSRAKE